MGAYTTINDPSVHFQSTLYTGNGSASSYAITNTGNANLKPEGSKHLSQATLSQDIFSFSNSS